MLLLRLGEDLFNNDGLLLLVDTKLAFLLLESGFSHLEPVSKHQVSQLLTLLRVVVRGNLVEPQTDFLGGSLLLTRGIDLLLGLLLQLLGQLVIGPSVETRVLLIVVALTAIITTIVVLFLATTRRLLLTLTILGPRFVLFVFDFRKRERGSELSCHGRPIEAHRLTLLLVHQLEYRNEGINLAVIVANSFLEPWQIGSELCKRILQPNLPVSFGGHNAHFSRHFNHDLRSHLCWHKRLRLDLKATLKVK